MNICYATRGRKEVMRCLSKKEVNTLKEQYHLNKSNNLQNQRNLGGIKMKLSHKGKQYIGVLSIMFILINMLSGAMVFADTPETNKSDIVIGTFNIGAGLNPDVNELRKLTESYHVDIVGLQEVDRNTARNDYDMLTSFGATSYPHTYYSKAMDHAGGDYGVGIASKYPMHSESTTFVETNASDEPRVFQRVLIEKDGKEIAVYNTHLSFESTEVRKKQFAQIKAALDSDNTEYKVVLGDFNSDQDNAEYYYFLDNYNIANGKAGVWHDTYNISDSTMKTYAVDNIITSKNIHVSKVEMVETKLSDHNFLYIEADFLDEDQPSNELLNIQLKKAKHYKAENYTATSFANLQNNISDAEQIANQSDARQIELDQAIIALNEAISGLVETNEEPVETDKSLLEQLLEENANKKADNYTVESWLEFAESLDLGKDIFTKEDATQLEIDNAITAINEAIESLVKMEEVPAEIDKSILEKLLEESEKKQADDYTVDSWTAFSETLELAKEILEKPNTTQDEVNQVITALNQMIDALILQDISDNMPETDKPNSNMTEPGKELPNTASNMFNYLAAGSLMILLSTFLLIRKRKNKVQA